jgi:hypothetical protein
LAEAIFGEDRFKRNYHQDSMEMQRRRGKKKSEYTTQLMEAKAKYTYGIFRASIQ